MNEHNTNHVSKLEHPASVCLITPVEVALLNTLLPHENDNLDHLRNQLNWTSQSFMSNPILHT